VFRVNKALLLLLLSCKTALLFVLQVNPLGVNGSNMKEQELQHTVATTICMRSFLTS